MELVECKPLNLTQYKALFILVTAVLALLVASPALQRVVAYPRTAFLTELSLLGPGHTAENYPYNITNGENNSVFLGISNQLGSNAYYQVQVKFRNETQSAPDGFNHTSSSLPSLYNLNVFVADKESLEIPVNFALDFSFQGVAQVNFDSLEFNGESLNLHGYSSDWNPKTNMFYGNLIFELWIFNSTLNDFQYHARFVDIKLNMNIPALS
jgi:uncharacterized membrane protein